MPLLRHASLADLFCAWQALPAFRGVDWRRVRLVVRPRRRGDPFVSTGEAADYSDGEWRILVRHGYSTADARMTLLHEMAHIAAWTPGAFHGYKWRAMFAQACAEATGAYPLVGPRGDLNPAVRALLRRGL
jgi:hypothetical protein